MGNQTDKKFTWVIKDFSSLQSEKIYSDKFFVGGCYWRLLAFPKGNKKADYFSLYLDVFESNSLPSGWRRHAKFTLTIINQILENKSEGKELINWFDEQKPNFGFPSMIPLSDIHAKGIRFLVNGELKIVANVEVLEVIGRLDVLEESTPVDVNGFQLLPSQENPVKRLFERNPEIASKFNINNPLMKSAYMNLVLSLIETLRQSPKEINKDDMADAYATLEFVSNAGFSLDWLKEKVGKVSEKKEKLEACETQVENLEEELNDLKQKCLDVEVLLEKKKVELLAFKAPLSDDDIFN